MPTLLALETSCDESAAAVVRDQRVLASAVASQVEEHARWGGVVPEIASRRHVEALPGLIEQVMAESGLAFRELDAIAATAAPGLVGALLVGSVTGRSLARLHNKPFVAVHHLEGHLCSVQLGDPLPAGPYLVLLVSGGHTEMIRVDGPGLYQRLARSRDDAAGEAFDKVARLLDLGYPGGPAIQAAAEQGDPRRFPLPKGRVSLPEGGFHPYVFSFSGLKTAVLRLVNQLKAEAESGGEPFPLADVAANRRLRARLEQRCGELGIQWRLAPLAYCTDNAAMIAVAAEQRFSAGACSPIDLAVAPRLALESAPVLYEPQAAF